MSMLQMPTDRGLRSIAYSRLVRIQGAGSYSRIYFADEPTLVVAKVLHWFEDRLPASMFIRVHRSHLINISYVKEIAVTGTRDILLSNGECIIMSKRKRMKLDLNIFFI